MTYTPTCRRPVGPHARPCRHEDQCASWVLLPDPSTVPKTRESARHLLAEWGVTDQGDVIELLISEVVTNAMRHAWGGMMTLCREHGTLRCEVQDTSSALPEVREAHECDEGGRGMFLLEALATRWGSYRVSAGKVVWFEITCPGESPACPEDLERSA
ncbi:ATP-binding protein [Sphaerisporangium fuscum]|uniref:ATP-binding protein n=1 Tax=Sphaerisporangium fuscum TaxID=2835868 RepID=UPI001BDD0361|nr:ATP-binding protein [Sphaerisporangium fuscum]